MYKVFADMHHSALLNSLILLFEKRLGGELFRPIGKEWYEKGFWDVYNHPSTVEQYLGIGGATPDGSRKLNEVVSNPTEGLYHCFDIEGDKTNKAITFEAFMELPIDIVIASIPEHIQPFLKLCQLHPNKPKLIYQVGNSWNIPNGSGVKNVMASAVIHNLPEGINFISYHQEFDLSTFYPETVDNFYGNKIYSFINCLNTDGLFKRDWDLFLELEKIMPDWEFRSYGGQCRDGNCNGTKEVADKMREATFIFHSKSGSDGFGHVIHSAMATGKPLLVNYQEYKDRLAGQKLIPGVNCIDVDNKSPEQISQEIIKCSEPTLLMEMGKNIYNKFKELVDYDKEELQIRDFLSRLQ